MEEFVGDVDTFDLLRMVTAEVDPRPTGVVGGDVGKNLRLPPPHVVFGNGGRREIALRRGIHEHHYAIRIGEWKWIEQYGVDHGENGGAGADTQRQNRDGGGGEARTVPEHAQRVADIAYKCFQIVPRSPG